MTYAGRSFMGTVSQPTIRPAERLAVYLRRQYLREHRHKRLSADIDCTPKAAENILNGHWPNDRHFAAIVRRFGRDVLDAVFGHEIDQTIARLTEEARQLEQQLDEIRARTRQAKGFAPQPDLFGPSPEDPLDRLKAALNVEAAPPDT